MGRKDIITKEYMEDTEVFADVFNHMIYKEKVIDPKNLKELDTVNVVIPYGADSWNAPRSLHEMLVVQDENILSLVPDYRINLIAPGEMSEEELEHFTSNFREVMQFIKYSKDTEKLSQLLEGNDAFETMDRKAVRVMEEMTGMKIEKEVEDEKVNVCKAIQGIEERGRAAGIVVGRSEGIQIGAEHEQRLTKALLSDNRIDDLKRALDDPAFRQKLL